LLVRVVLLLLLLLLLVLLLRATHMWRRPPNHRCNH
jgi:hypothetical protein